MPTYEYDCQKCGIVYDCSQSMNDAPLDTCSHPEGCRHPRSKAKVTRLIGTGAGLIFKGSGFYITDYRSSEYKESAKKETQAPAPAASEKSPSEPAKTSSAESNGKSKPKKD
jgi:putative FmdB family regulatory protein